MAQDQGGPSPAVKPGEMIGILGGGQLGRMLALSAADLGLSVHIYSPDEAPPAALVSAHHIQAPYTDEKALRAFAQSVRVVTTEFENVPVKAVEILEDSVYVRPGAEALRVAQDRLAEKEFLSSLNIPVAPFQDISSAEDVDKAMRDMAFPAVLKTRRLGYDGKGQAKIDKPDELIGAWESLGRVPCCLEGFVAFDGEASVILARGPDGAMATYDLVENAHENHILSQSSVPARWGADLANGAFGAAQAVADALGYIGVLTVEFFVTPSGLIANEIAPRVHNSGHWTIEGARTSQFENHIRAICGWPLGPTECLGKIRMQNLIGGQVNQWTDLLSQPGAHLHLYGKRDVREGRKMGHVTWVT